MTLMELAARNVLRNRVRTVLTVLGVAMTVLTFILLRTVVYAWTVAIDYAPKDRIVTRHKVTFVMSLPQNYVDKVKAMDGVRATTWANWFGGKDPLHPNEFFATLAIDPATYFDVYDEVEVPDDQRARFMEDRQGAIVGDVLAAKLGWKVGDRVTLESTIWPAPPDAPWTFNVDGIYTASSKSVDRSTMIFHWGYFNDQIGEASRNQVGWVVSRITDPKRAADISVAIDRGFEDADIQTLSQDERTFQASFLAMFSAILAALDAVSVGILLIMLLILGNTIAMGVRERTNEYGVLRAIGFTPRHVAGFVVGEALVVGFLGGALGLLLAYPVVELGIGRFLEENMGAMFPYFRIPPATAALAMGLALTLGAISAALPALGAARLKVTEALRRVA